MRINHKILSIPPYISTSWKNVLSLHVEQEENKPFLMIGLANGSFVEVPHLDTIVIEAIFAAHEKYLEMENPIPQKNPSTFPSQKTPPTISETSAIISFPFRIEGPENLGSMLQHNSDAANSPDLPKEMLEKIATLSKVIGFDNAESFPKPEPHCNCTHCQIMRAIHGEALEQPKEIEPIPELVTAEDLKFRDWEIKQTADKLFIVTNPLNEEEHYNVFLGSPVGCTCGEKNCEHIRAVLNS